MIQKYYADSFKNGKSIKVKEDSSKDQYIWDDLVQPLALHSALDTTKSALDQEYHEQEIHKYHF